MQTEHSAVLSKKIRLLQAQIAEIAEVTQYDIKWKWDAMGDPNSDVISCQPPPNISCFPTGFGLALERLEQTSLMKLAGCVEDDPNYLLERYLSEQQPSWLRHDLPTSQKYSVAPSVGSIYSSHMTVQSSVRIWDDEAAHWSREAVDADTYLHAHGESQTWSETLMTEEVSLDVEVDEISNPSVNELSDDDGHPPGTNGAARERSPDQIALVGSDGLYHCPWEGKDCNHMPTKLKCNYDKFVDSHREPYRCKVQGCEVGRYSSTTSLLRHEREAHAVLDRDGKSYLCSFSGCERGLPGYGFPLLWSLRDHMRRVHGADLPDQPVYESEIEMPTGDKNTVNEMPRRMEYTRMIGQIHMPTRDAVDHENCSHKNQDIASEETSSDAASDTSDNDSVTSVCYLLTGLNFSLGSRNEANQRLIDETLSSHTDASKQVIVDRIMDECSGLFDYFWNAIIRVHGQHGSSSSSSQTKHVISLSGNTTANGTGRKHYRVLTDDGADEDSDSNIEKRPKLTKTSTTDTKNKVRFACHFRKHNPTKYDYTSQKYRSCAMLHWSTISRVKEHLFRRHLLPIHCHRCWKEFETQLEYETHITVPDIEICSRSTVTMPFEGISSDIQAKLRSRKRKPRNRSEADRWRDIFSLLFPGEPVPEPYFCYMQDTPMTGRSLATGELADFEEHCRQELPRRVRQLLENAINAQTQPIEESLKSQIIEIVGRFQEEIFAEFRARPDVSPHTPELQPDSTALEAKSTDAREPISPLPAERNVDAFSTFEGPLAREEIPNVPAPQNLVHEMTGLDDLGSCDMWSNDSPSQDYLKFPKLDYKHPTCDCIGTCTCLNVSGPHGGATFPTHNPPSSGTDVQSLANTSQVDLPLPGFTSVIPDIQCNRCQAPFETISEFLSHEMNIDCPIRCPWCTEVFPKKALRQVHCEQMH